MNKAIADIDLIRSAYQQPLQWKPGDKDDYSNLGYYILGEVITRASGMPWSESSSAACSRRSVVAGVLVNPRQHEV